jgi:hypothetical protein
MTTYQDPPLQSRRAARQGERAQAEGTTQSVPDSADSAARAVAAGTAEPLNYATTSRPPLPQYDGQNLRPRRTFESAEHAVLPPTETLPNETVSSYRPRDFSPEGRRSAPTWSPQYGGVGNDGTVEFQTQGRENVPVAIAPAAASTESASAPVFEAPAASSPAVIEYTMTRRELRALREAGLITDVTDLSQLIQQFPVPSHPPVADGQQADVAPARNEQAEAARDVPADEAQIAGVAVSGGPAENAPAAVAAILDPIPLVAPAPQSSSRLNSALAEFDALAAGREPAVVSADAPSPVTGRRAVAPLVDEAPVADSEQPVELSGVEPQLFIAAELFTQPESLPPSTEGLSAFDALFQPPSAANAVVVALPLDVSKVHHDVIEAELEPDAERSAEPPVAAAPSTAAQLLAPPLPNVVPVPLVPVLVDPLMVDPLMAAPAPQGFPALVPPPAYPTPVDLPAPSATQAPVAVSPFDFLVVAPQAEPAVSEAASLEPAVGHWSTQADIDDAEQTNKSTISRRLGAGNGAITTSALVLPSVPEHLIGGPIGDGGGILLTGSISLPDSLSLTGALPSQLDQSDIDHILDPGDLQVASTDSAPVRAIRAVSTHTASGGIVSPTKPNGTRGFTILIIAASAMAVVVVGLLVAGLVSGTL